MLGFVLGPLPLLLGTCSHPPLTILSSLQTCQSEPIRSQKPFPVIVSPELICANVTPDVIALTKYLSPSRQEAERWHGNCCLRSDYFHGNMGVALFGVLVGTALPGLCLH